MKQLFGAIILGASLFSITLAEPAVWTSKLAGDLAEELEVALVKGGDDRLVISALNGSNKYFTGPRLRPSVIARSSSTSSNISRLGFLAAQQLFDRLKAAQADGGAARYFEYSMDHMRRQIKQFWATTVKQPCHVITTPSGSDAEMLPTLAALVRNDKWQPNTEFARPLVMNIVMASGEVGSGTALASKLCHFSNLTPVGAPVIVGKQVAGVAQGTVGVVEVKIRDDRGVVVGDQDLENRLTALIQQAIEQDGQKVVVHMVHACKTGISAPRETFLHAMKKKYKDDLIVVVDAAQLRMDEVAIGSWLDAGFWVLLTGSKFLGGPSFAGAIVVPYHDAELLAAASRYKIPVGLSDYFTPADCDDLFINLQKALPPWYNVGLALRWAAALAEADLFCGISSDRRDRGIGHWAKGVRNLVKQSKHLKLLEEILPQGNERTFSNCIGKCNSVVSFGVSVIQADGESKFLNTAQLRNVYELMTQDLSSKFNRLGADLQNIAATQCLIGQPVQIATAGPCTAVLRTAIAVPEIYKAIGHERVDPAVLVDELLYDDQLVMQKLDLIAMYWAELSS